MRNEKPGEPGFVVSLNKPLYVERDVPPCWAGLAVGYMAASSGGMRRWHLGGRSPWLVLVDADVAGTWCADQLVHFPLELADGP